MIRATIQDPHLDSLINSLISASIIKGLDIAGFVSEDPQVGQKSVQITRNQNVDLYVIPGTTYTTSDGFNIVVYNKPEKYQQGLLFEQILNDCHHNGYLTLVYNLGKKNAHMLLKLFEKTGLKPTFVEILNSKVYGFQYQQTNSYEVVSSGAESPKELTESRVYSHVPRKDMEEFHIIPEGEGMDFTPNYLQSTGDQNANNILH